MKIICTKQIKHYSSNASSCLFFITAPLNFRRSSVQPKWLLLLSQQSSSLEPCPSLYLSLLGYLGVRKSSPVHEGVFNKSGHIRVNPVNKVKRKIFARLRLLSVMYLLVPGTTGHHWGNVLCCDHATVRLINDYSFLWFFGRKEFTVFTLRYMTLKPWNLCQRRKGTLIP